MTTDNPVAAPAPGITPAPATAAHRVLTALFTISVVFFLLAGLAIVLGQIVTLIQADSVAARGWKSDLAPWAFGGASVAGVVAFALSYHRTPPQVAETRADHLG